MPRPRAAKPPAQRKNYSKKNRRQGRQRGALLQLPSRINHTEVYWKQRFAEIEPDGHAGVGNSTQEVFRLYLIAPNDLCFLKPGGHQSESQRQRKKGSCAQ